MLLLLVRLLLLLLLVLLPVLLLLLVVPMLLPLLDQLRWHCGIQRTSPLQPAIVWVQSEHIHLPGCHH